MRRLCYEPHRNRIAMGSSGCRVGWDVFRDVVSFATARTCSADSVRRGPQASWPAPEIAGLRRARRTAEPDHLMAHSNLHRRSVATLVPASPERAFVDAGQEACGPRVTTVPI